MTDDFVELLPTDNVRRMRTEAAPVAVTLVKIGGQLRASVSLSQTKYAEFSDGRTRFACDYSATRHALRLRASASGPYVFAKPTNRGTHHRRLIRIPLPASVATETRPRAVCACFTDALSGHLTITLPPEWCADRYSFLDVKCEADDEPLPELRTPLVRPPHPVERLPTAKTARVPPRSPVARSKTSTKKTVVPEPRSQQIVPGSAARSLAQVAAAMRGPKRGVAVPNPNDPPPGRSALDQGYRPGSGIAREKD